MVDAAGVDDRGAEDGEDFLAGLARCGAWPAAISRTVTPLGFSLDTGLAMNSNRLCRAANSAGKTRSPWRPTTMRSPMRHVGHRHAAGGRPFRVDEDAAVHLLVLDLDPLAAETHLRAVVGRAVEVLGKRPVHVGGHDVAIVRGDRGGTVVVDLAEDLLQHFGGRRPHLDAGEAGIGLALADADVLEDVRPAVRQDLVQHLGQEQRIDDVALDLDLFDEPGRCSARR